MSKEEQNLIYTDPLYCAGVLEEYARGKTIESALRVPNPIFRVDFKPDWDFLTRYYRVKLQDIKKSFMKPDEYWRTPDGMVETIRAHEARKEIQCKTKDVTQAGWNRCSPKFGFNFAVFDYRPAPPELANGHNPAGLTTDQVPDGIRLLDADEIVKDGPPLKEIWLWLQRGEWSKLGFNGCAPEYTYATPHSREQLAEARGSLKPWRNLDGDERARGFTALDNDIQAKRTWPKPDADWRPFEGAVVNEMKFNQFRTRLSREELAAKYFPEPVSPAPKKIVPWTMGDVPPNAWYREESGGFCQPYLIYNGGLDFPCIGIVTWQKLFDHWQFSTTFAPDSWKRCGKEAV